ncbi:MAG: major facilitator superfamily MFS1 [Elusimicrobia bacterium]|nr:MAG: major facilitator superfamily MFS1 [Elusimicrobiota bacterium]KAF0154478.1 MAG: major facilitator superfamily MFS1 [Elusimicrobiota bacterium]
MKGYARLIGAHPRVLASGVLLTLFSGFGQTFLISLFVPDLLSSFGLDKIGFGALYSGATLGAALIMPRFGRLLDRSTVPFVTLLAAAILMTSCALVALSPGPAWLFAGVMGLRLGGQGMFGLIAAASMARHFDAHRGRALGVASLGYPLGEAMLPAAVMTLIGAFGWRWSMGIMGAVILLVFLPVVLRLMRGTGVPEQPLCGPRCTELCDVPALTDAAAAARAGGKSAVRTLLADPASRAVLLVFLVPPFALTGLFLYQALLCEYKGWPPAVMAGGFAAFAAARFAGSLAAGTLIDTLGAARLLRVYLLPFIAGLAVVYLADGPWAAAAFMALCGFTTGPGEAIQTALWSDIYGAEVIGGIKGFTSMISVVGTAAAPLFAGYLIQSGGGYGTFLLSLLAVAAAGAAIPFLLDLKAPSLRSRFLRK